MFVVGLHAWVSGLGIVEPRFWLKTLLPGSKQVRRTHARFPLYCPNLLRGRSAFPNIWFACLNLVLRRCARNSSRPMCCWELLPSFVKASPATATDMLHCRRLLLAVHPRMKVAELSDLWSSHMLLTHTSPIVFFAKARLLRFNKNPGAVWTTSPSVKRFRACPGHKSVQLSWARPHHLTCQEEEVCKVRGVFNSSNLQSASGLPVRFC